MPLMNLGLGWAPSTVVQSDDEVARLWSDFQSRQAAAQSAATPLTQQQVVANQFQGFNPTEQAFAQSAFGENGGDFYRDFVKNTYGNEMFDRLNSYQPDYTAFNNVAASSQNAAGQYNQFQDARTASRQNQQSAYTDQLGGGFTGGIMGGAWSTPAASLSPAGTNDPTASGTMGSETPWNTPGYSGALGAYNPAAASGMTAGWGGSRKTPWG